MSAETLPEDEGGEQIARVPAALRPSSNVALRDQSTAKKMLEQLRGVFQRTLASDPGKTDKFLRMGVSCLTYQPKLLECDQLSFTLALMQCAELGLMPGPTTGHAYLVPFKDHGRPRVTLIPGYKGLVHCAYRSGEIDRVLADVVRVGDEFSYSRGTKAEIHHVPGPQEGEITHAYVVVNLRGSSLPSFVVLDRIALERTKKRSKSYMAGLSSGRKDGPWFTDEAAMSMKTAFKRIVPWIPVSYELQEILDIDSRDEDREEMKRRTLSSGGFLPKGDTEPLAEPEQAPEPTRALPDRTEEPAQDAELAKPQKRKVATRVAPQKAPEPQKREVPVEEAPKGPPPHDERYYMGLIMDLVPAVNERLPEGTEPEKVPVNLETMSLASLTQLHKRLLTRFHSL